jgi:hypothetical protein
LSSWCDLVLFFFGVCFSWSEFLLLWQDPVVLYDDLIPFLEKKSLSGFVKMWLDSSVWMWFHWIFLSCVMRVVSDRICTFCFFQIRLSASCSQDRRKLEADWHIEKSLFWMSVLPFWSLVWFFQLCISRSPDSFIAAARKNNL